MKRENVPASISIPAQQNLKGSQKNLFTIKNDPSNINPPLKLLSSLTKMVNSSAKENICNTQKPINTGVPEQQNIRPVLFQLPGGGNILSTHMLNTTRLTPAQLIELQKSLAAHQNKQQNAIRGVMSQSQPVVSSSTVVTTTNDSSNIIVGLTNKNSIQNFIMVTNAGQSKPANTVQTTKGFQMSPQAQQLLQKSQGSPQGLTPNATPMAKDNLITNKALQEQLKHLTLAQREQLLRQYMAGKMTSVGNVTAPMLLASILKNKQGFPMTTRSPTNTQSTKKPVKVSICVYIHFSTCLCKLLWKINVDSV